MCTHTLFLHNRVTILVLKIVVAAISKQRSVKKPTLRPQVHGRLRDRESCQDASVLRQFRHLDKSLRPRGLGRLDCRGLVNCQKGLRRPENPNQKLLSLDRGQCFHVHDKNTEVFCRLHETHQVLLQRPGRRWAPDGYQAVVPNPIRHVRRNFKVGPVPVNTLGSYNDKGIDLPTLSKHGGVVDAHLGLSRPHFHEVSPVRFIPGMHQHIVLMLVRSGLVLVVGHTWYYISHDLLLQIEITFIRMTESELRNEKLMTSTVYVTQENPRVNIVSASQWGDLEPLTNPFDQIHLNPAKLVSQIRRKLRGFGDDDWLLAMGDPAIIGVAFAIAAEMNRGRVNLLKWDKMEKSYYPVKIGLRGSGIENLNPDEEIR